MAITSKQLREPPEEFGNLKPAIVLLALTVLAIAATIFLAIGFFGPETVSAAPFPAMLGVGFLFYAICSYRHR